MRPLIAFITAIFRHLSRDVDEQFKQVCHGMVSTYISVNSQSNFFSSVCILQRESQGAL